MRRSRPNLRLITPSAVSAARSIDCFRRLGRRKRGSQGRQRTGARVVGRRRSRRVRAFRPVDAEIVGVLKRPKFASAIALLRRQRFLAILRSAAVWFEPAVRVTDCRDAKDNKYLELALAAGAETIVSGDIDLLVLHPWRGVRILLPADYLAISRPCILLRPLVSGART